MLNPKLVLVLLALTLASCTTQQMYGAGQGWQRSQCAGIPDRAEYDRCMTTAATSYDSYKWQTDSGRKQ